MSEYFDTPDKLYLVLDYVEGGELFDRIVDEVRSAALELWLVHSVEPHGAIAYRILSFFFFFVLRSSGVCWLDDNILLTDINTSQTHVAGPVFRETLRSKTQAESCAK